MEINTQQLEALLELLVTSGVEEFEGFGFHVRFTEAMFTPDKQVPVQEQVVEAKSEPAPESIWEDESLWHGHRPLRFPRKEK